MTRPRAWWLLAVLCLAASACSIADRRAGVPNRWQRAKDSFHKGQTTMGQVIDFLGPPSQILALGGRTVLYYLLEDAHTEELTLILYNQSETKVAYDRAVFFFDPALVLEEWSVSSEALPEDGD